MARMRNFEAEAEQAIGRTWHELTHPFQHDGQPRTAEHVAAAYAARQTPATMPATMAPATAAAATPQEDNMSVITDIEDGWTAAKAELAKFEQGLPGALAKAKQFEASPFAQIAEKAAASVLPPEAVAIAVNAADKVIDDLSALYGPPQPVTDPAPTGQQPVQAPAA